MLYKYKRPSGILIFLITMSLIMTCVLPTEPEEPEEKIIDYAIFNPLYPSAVESGSVFEGSLFIVNSGNGDGAQPIIWTVYLSTDNSFEITDTVVDSGLVSSLLTSEVSEQITFTGTWPDDEVEYYLIIDITATDDTTLTNNQNVSSGLSATTPVEVSGVDYEVFTPTYPGVANVSTQLDGSFYIVNSGNVNGVQPVNWTVYLSSDNTYQANDT